MSEEEIIKTVENFLDGYRQYNVETGETYVPYKYGKGQKFCYVEDFEAIQGLLDLYNKEKEKNKELLENATVTYFNDEELKESVGNYLGVLLKKNIEKDYISKDKIREQIKQIKSEEANIYFKEHVVYFLQELLEEE